MRVFFSNFTVTADSFEIKQGYSITHKLNEPWNGFVKSNNFVRGRPKENKFEPYLNRLLNTLNESWDSVAYEKEIEPIVSLIDEYDSSNQIKGRIYAY